MMPAASTKVEILTSAEAQDPMKVALNLILKKTRNLEKRKGKLDELRKKATTGSVLEKDQEDAIGHYKEVTANLEFARELSKHFTQINTDAEKLQRKQAKRDRFERQMQDQKLVFEVLQLQCLLDIMGTDSVRNDYLSGNLGAVVLTQENLDQLDELVQVVTPEQDGSMKAHLAQLQVAAEHIVNLLEGKDKEAFGTNYKVMKELLDRMNGCGYFDNMYNAEANEEEVAEMDDCEEQQNIPNDAGGIPGEENQDVIEHQYDYEEEGDMEPVSESPDQVSLRLQMENLTANSLPVQAADISSTSTSQPAPDSTVPMTGNYEATDGQRQSAEVRSDPYYQPSRQFQDIVSSVQGSFNFLQESTIETENAAAAAHMDSSSRIHPAGHSGAGDSAVLTGFTTANLRTDKPTSALTGQSAHLPSTQDFDIGSFSSTSVASSCVVSSGSGDSLQQQQQAQSLQKQQSNLDSRMKDSSSFASSESYSQSIHSQNLSNVSKYSVDDKASSLSQQQQSQSVSSVLSQSSAVPSASDPSISSFDPPPPIPLPNEAQKHAEDGSDSQHESDKKSFGTHLNANAAVFHSMYTGPSPQSSSSNDTYSSNTHASQNTSSDSDYQGGGSSGGGYQGGSFRGSTYTRGGNRGNNSYRGSGGRGGMQNMYGRNSSGPRGGFNDRGSRTGGGSGGGQGGGYMNGRGGSKGMRGGSGGGMQRGSGMGSGQRGGFGRPSQ